MQRRYDVTTDDGVDRVLGRLRYPKKEASVNNAEARNVTDTDLPAFAKIPLQVESSRSSGLSCRKVIGSVDHKREGEKSEIREDARRGGRGARKFPSRS